MLAIQNDVFLEIENNKYNKYKLLKIRVFVFIVLIVFLLYCSCFIVVKGSIMSGVRFDSTF